MSGFVQAASLIGTGNQNGSTAPGLYGIKYNLTVTNPLTETSDSVLSISDSSFEPEALRIVFDVNTIAWNNYWFADIDIYNYDLDSAETLINSASNISLGATVTLKAGFQNGNYDTIWVGPVFQATFVRENVTDYKLTLHCILGLLQAMSGEVISNVFAGFDQTEVVTSMIKSMQLSMVSPITGLGTQRLWRDKVIIGNQKDVLDSYAKSNGAVWFLTQRGIAAGNTGLYFGSLATANSLETTPGFTYTPNNGLIGTPEQTQLGVNCSVLLDPRVFIKLPIQTFAIQQAFINQAVGGPTNPYQKPLSTTGTYVAFAVRHRGDTRGNLWQTDITGLLPNVSVLDQLVRGS